MNSLTILVFVCMISVSLSCKCAVFDVKHYFCSSDFSLKIEVLTDKEKTTDSHEVSFGTKVTQIFKADDRMKKAIISGKFYTSDSSASCGVQLNNGQTYIVTGFLNNGKLHLNSCGFIREVDQLTAQEKQFYDNQYKTVVC